MKRHAVPPFLDFDYRANVLKNVVGEDEVQRQHRAQLNEGLGQQFGVTDLERKVEDFSAIGALPSSIVAHHNMLLRQVRDAFVGGQYYPALWDSAS